MQLDVAIHNNDDLHFQHDDQQRHPTLPTTNNTTTYTSNTTTNNYQHNDQHFQHFLHPLTTRRPTTTNTTTYTSNDTSNDTTGRGKQHHFHRLTMGKGYTLPVEGTTLLCYGKKCEKPAAWKKYEQRA